MNDIQTVCTFLKEAGIYYIATEEGDQPRVRPFGTAHIYQGRLYIQTGLKKKVAAQLKADPKIEICAMNKGKWIRVEGEAVYDSSAEAQQSLLDDYPELKKMYAVNDGNTAVYYIKNGKAVISSFTDAPIEIEF